MDCLTPFLYYILQNEYWSCMRDELTHLLVRNVLLFVAFELIYCVKLTTFSLEKKSFGMDYELLLLSSRKLMQQNSFKEISSKETNSFLPFAIKQA